MIAYLWAEDLSDAVAVPNGMPAALGTDHDVPNATDCETCHNNQPGRFIGVSALQLDYDYSGLTVARLQAQGRLSQSVPSAAHLPGDATAQAALGILHVNCGTCHNPNSTLPYKALDLWQRVSMLSDVTVTPFYLSTVGVASGTNPDVSGPATIVAPGHPDQSALVYRMNTRMAKVAMPPLASKQVDGAAVDTVSQFIAGLK
jgi:cytochrome c556